MTVSENRVTQCVNELSNSRTCYTMRKSFIQRETLLSCELTNFKTCYQREKHVKDELYQTLTN